MADGLDREALKDWGAGRPASEPVARLYRQAFADFGPRYLWSRQPSPVPTFAQALTIADGLRREGDLKARALAAEIEQACRAAV